MSTGCTLAIESELPGFIRPVEFVTIVTGGRLVINAIRKEVADQSVLSELNYETHLWQEKEIKSVANVTRRDVREFLHLAAIMRLVPTIQEYPLSEANEALVDLKTRPVTGAKVLVIDR
jgi:propanol-preferring alcohol dehydrogenase